jgi:plastocyanin
MYKKAILVLLAGMLALGACAGVQEKPQEVAAKAGERKVAMTASSFKFEPSALRVQGTGSLVIEVKNVESMGHNLTVKSPAGSVLKSVDLPGNSTTKVDLKLSEKGKYEFYCDKTMHTTMGMKGVIEVVDAK